MTIPLPGEYGVVTTNGWAARLIQFVTRSHYNHAFVYVGHGRIIEGRPRGAGDAPLTKYRHVLWGVTPLNPLEREHIVAAAERRMGTPYSFVDCAAIGLADLFGWKVPVAVRKRLNRKDRLMCSQLVDQCYLEAGVHLFTDGRVPNDVAPSDLADLALGKTPR